MKKILVPTDFSDNALNAVNYAISIAKVFHARVTLLHTYSFSQPTGMMRSMDSILVQDAENEMEALIKKLPDDVAIDFRIKKGEPVPTIAGHSDQYDLIVMGTQGASGLKEVFIGSVTGGVMRHTHTPVLAIPCGYGFRPIHNIGFAAAELQPTEDIALLKEFATELDASVFVFQHTDEKKASSEAPSNLEWLGDIPHTVTVVSNDKTLDANILDFVEKKEIGLLCMVRRKRNITGFFGRLIKDSVTLTQVFNCEIPLLILHSE